MLEMSVAEAALDHTLLVFSYKFDVANDKSLKVRKNFSRDSMSHRGPGKG